MSAKLIENIRENGQLETIIVRPIGDGYEVVNGNHRLDAFKEVGINRVMTFNLGSVSLRQAKKIAVITNETRFMSDSAKLAALLKDISQEFSAENMQKVLPYDQEKIEDLLNLANFDWNKFNTQQAAGVEAASAAQDHSGSPMPPSEEGFETIQLCVPQSLAMQWHEQLTRFKKALYPNEEPEHVSPVMPFEAMLQHLAQIPDGQLVG